MDMLILAGGFGTRLQSVVSDVPKALAPVGDVTFLYLQIENWISQGQRSFVFLLHHQAKLIINFLEIEKNHLFKDCEVNWIVEETPMDTGGAVAYAVRKLDLSGDFILSNADTWLGSGVLETVRSDEPSIAVVSLNNASRYGRVKFNSENTVTAFLEKIDGEEPGWINAGLCHLNAGLFKNWNGMPFSLERVLFPELVGKGVLKAVPLKTDFIDIGIPDDYFRFCRWIELKKVGAL